MVKWESSAGYKLPPSATAAETPRDTLVNINGSQNKVHQRGYNQTKYIPNPVKSSHCYTGTFNAEPD